MKRALAFAAAALFVSAWSFGDDAHGAGLERPNVVGARAIGIGGGYTAIADDPTAVWHNPSGIATYGDNVGYIGAELVVTDRAYTPDAQSPLGQAGITTTIHENTAPTFIPVIGASTRFGFGKSAPTRFAFAILVYDAYGGSISFNGADISKNDPSTGKPQVVGISSTQITDLELTPTLAYQVSDVVSIGAGLRVGINSFSVNDTESAFSAKLSGSGVGIGGIFGLMVRPHRLVQIGAVYRTPLSASISGSGPLTIGSAMPVSKDFGLNITWPQSAGLGVTVFPHRRILATVQADWTAWSSIQKLAIDIGDLVQNKEMRYMDTYAIHAGLQGVITRYLVARVGGSLDSNAIPDRTVRRENQDVLKGTVAAGLGVHFWKIFVDGAFELIVPTDGRVVATALPSAAGPENETGKYRAVIYSAELSAQIRF
ncbi:MAG: rane protein involved in aromatic hydrocarbon degradation [bacterium]|nr:rane protein involved in aromatic hydrocarbon degradation [bacterium]